MITNLAQRWRDRRGSYRPAGEVITPSELDVVELLDDNIAKEFVVRHHYLGSYPAARRRFALARRGELSGVMVFSVPMRDDVLELFPGSTEESLVLGRLVLLDDVPGNAESWFLARAFELLRKEGFVGVRSDSDPARYADSIGASVFGGHVGTIYQATNGCYLGIGKPSTKYILPNGRAFSKRAMSKVRKREQGWRYSARILENFGASPLSDGEDSAAWLRRWTGSKSPEAITRTMRHPGNHQYAWILPKKLRDKLPSSRPYPKLSHP